MNQTVVGIFETAAQAQQAAQRLAAAGFSTEHVDVSSNTSGSTSGSQGSDSNYRNSSGTAVEGAADAAGRTAEQAGDGISNFFSNLFGGDDSDDARRYSHVARNSGSVVTVHAHSAENAHQAAQILDEAGAVDVNERASQTGYQTGNNYSAGSTASNVQGGATAQVIEENLQVGKRVEQTGGARLRSRIVERPVEASVRLREEHVNVERRPVDRPATEADFAAFKEGNIEITESAERAVVGKEARVVEEVSLGKEVTEREEVVRDTVRKTEVDVERLDGRTGVDTRTNTDSDSDYNQRNR
ncbi:conserved domain-containing protein [Hymenobacter gelipurpurascens]|uniref:Conserved domain-containing protein n=1 Tax=Hymenobacter gelipurpurascens TaxID=89968 RepID=A0A212UCK0_9BACT|nr:YsnF/AvaK domain-containing protein [Hymenobacter gelipurpurascens]SNC75975.1 conserved domain-containing protein [Hymenobacter gelipurpurascens]